MSQRAYPEPKPARLLSVAEWAALPEDEAGELIDGRLVEEEMPDCVHELAVAWLVHTLRAWLAPRRGFVFAPGPLKPDALRRFTSEVRGLVNVTRLPQAPSVAELAALGVARVSWGTLLHWDAMARFEEQLASLA